MLKKSEIEYMAGLKGKDQILLESEYKTLEMDIMARLYSMFNSMAREMKYVKESIDPKIVNPMMNSPSIYGGSRQTSLSKEEKKALKKRAQRFCEKRLEAMRDIIKENFDDDDDEDDEQDENRHPDDGMTVYFAKKE